MKPPVTIWTIGHSTRSLEKLIQILQDHKIEVLADVRSFPSSARYPHFNKEVLSRQLPEAGITYCWMGRALGGYRKKTRPDSPHTALRSAGFRNYADHMETDTFQQGITELLRLAKKKRVAYMCAERLWWRCHRSLVSDYLVAVWAADVVHLLDKQKSEPHRLSRLVRVAEGQLIYDVGPPA